MNMRFKFSVSGFPSAAGLALCLFVQASGRAQDWQHDPVVEAQQYVAPSGGTGGGGSGTNNTAFVQAAGKSADTAYTQMALSPMTVTAGNLMLVGYSWSGDNAGPSVTVTDSLANVYQESPDGPINDTVDGQLVVWFCATNITGGADTISVNSSLSESGGRVVAGEFSGASGFDAHGNGWFTNSVITVTTLSLASTNEMAVGFGMQSSAITPDPAPGAGFTQAAGGITDSGNSALILEYQKITNTTSVPVTFKFVGGGSSTLEGCGISLRSK